MKTAPDVPWRPCGEGMAAPTFSCLGCGRSRWLRGSTGLGVRRRCADCTAARAARRAAAP